MLLWSKGLTWLNHQFLTTLLSFQLYHCNTVLITEKVQSSADLWDVLFAHAFPICICIHVWIQRGIGGPYPPGKSQVKWVL